MNRSFNNSYLHFTLYRYIITTIYILILLKKYEKYFLLFLAFSGHLFLIQNRFLIKLVLLGKLILSLEKGITKCFTNW